MNNQQQQKKTALIEEMFISIRYRFVENIILNISVYYNMSLFWNILGIREKKTYKVYIHLLGIFNDSDIPTMIDLQNNSQ